MGKIILTRGKVALVDDIDEAWLSKYNWVATPVTKSTTNWYAVAVLNISMGLLNKASQR